MRRAREWSCPFTGEPADELHHLTGRDSDGEYLDDELLVPLVLDQHAIEHQIWDRSGVDEHVVANAFWLRARRVGQFLNRLGEHHGSGVVTLPAPLVRQLGLFILRMAAEILRLLDGER